MDQALVLGTRRLVFAHCKEFDLEGVGLWWGSLTGYPCYSRVHNRWQSTRQRTLYRRMQICSTPLSVKKKKVSRFYTLAFLTNVQLQRPPAPQRSHHTLLRGFVGLLRGA